MLLFLLHSFSSILSLHKPVCLSQAELNTVADVIRPAQEEYSGPPPLIWTEVGVFFLIHCGDFQTYRKVDTLVWWTLSCPSSSSNNVAKACAIHSHPIHFLHLWCNCSSTITPKLSAWFALIITTVFRIVLLLVNNYSINDQMNLALIVTWSSFQ